MDGPADDQARPLDPKSDDAPRGGASEADVRLLALEREMAALRRDVDELRRGAPRANPEVHVPPPSAAPRLDAAMADALRRPPRTPRSPGAAPPPSFGDRITVSAAEINGDRIESLVGRYGTLVLAAAVILSAVGAVIKMAVERGLITPEVRVAGGLLVGAVLAGAGLYFRRKGEVRYGGVLLALALAVVDLVAWAAGPMFHLVPTVIALSLIDLVAIAVASVALADESEFLFVVAVGGALSAPFVTSDGGGTAAVLFTYGAGVLAGALRAVREPKWRGAFALLVGGALLYSLAAAALPMSVECYGPFAVAIFGGVCALLALTLGEPQWRASLPRAYLAVAMVGAMVGWDAFARQPAGVTLGVAVALAAITYAALLQREGAVPWWRTSAVSLPLVSLSIGFAATHGAAAHGAAIGVWAAFALIAWRMERSAGEVARGGAHLLAASLLGGLAIAVGVWAHPLLLVAALSGWAVVCAGLMRDEETILPVFGLVAVLGGAVLSSLDQLLSRYAYSYVPFATRSSASALLAAIGIGAAGFVISEGEGEPAKAADRGARLGSLIGFLILWGRMEVAQAYSPDLSAFLLSSYYAACGVGSIIAGRSLGLRRLRMAGLGLALYAAFKALVEVTDIRSLALRVGAYAAVGVFLLGAGWLYRERSDSPKPYE